MIAPLRRRHRSMFVVLAVAVPALFLTALAHRPTAPLVPKLPIELVSTTPSAGQSLELFADYAASLLVDADGAHLTLEALAPLRQPDLLAYFSTGAPAASSLPAEAHLLGPVAWGQPRTFALPPAAADGGHLLLYSLPHQEVTAAAELPGFELPTPPALPDEALAAEEGVNP